MKVSIFPHAIALGQAAGKEAARLIKQAIAEKGRATIILATGTSQFETLNQLVKEPEIDWHKVKMFHLDEYIGLPESSPASFRNYLKQRFLARVPPLSATYLINGETDPGDECGRLGKLLQEHPVDVALIGIGENGHLAFNDPPADFETEAPFITVSLDEPCRKQQFSEGWFTTIDEVPHQAISMSVKQILKARHLICSVPDKRKALAVKNTLEQPNNLYPASILRNHVNCSYYLDHDSAALLTDANR